MVRNQARTLKEISIADLAGLRVLKGAAFYEKLWDSRSETEYDDLLVE